MKKLLLLIALTFSLNTIAQVPSYVPTDSLVGYWPFNGNANDESGNGNDGSNFGAIDTTDRFGQVNSAYLFSNSYIEVQPISAFNGATNFTWGAWVFLDSTVPNTPHFVLSRGWDYSNGFNFHLTQNSVNQVINGFNTFAKSSTAQPMTNIWHHVAISRSGSIVNFYMNGSLDTTHTFSSPVGTNSELFYIGAHKWIGQQPGYYPYYFKGKIDDVGIWDRALSQCEIQDLFLAGTMNNVTQTGATLSADQAGATYQWLDCNDNNAIINGETNQSYTPTVTGNYSVEVNMNGCVDTSTCYLVDYTGLSELYSEIVSIYPNPASNKITINGLNDLTDITKIEITSITGAIVRKENITNSVIDISMLNSGMYLLFISHENGFEKISFLKE